MSDPNDREATEEWREQERTLREERLGLAPTDAGPRAAQYRLLARVLLEPAQHSPPADFAARVVKQAAASRGDERVEVWLLGGLLAMLALTGVVFLAGDAAEQVRVLIGGHSAAGSDAASSALGWALAVGACIVLSLLIELWDGLGGPRPTRLDKRA